MHESIKALASEANTDVVIFSGADKSKLEETFGDLPVWLAAENGMYLRTSVPQEDEEVSEIQLPSCVSDSCLYSLVAFFSVGDLHKISELPDILTGCSSHDRCHCYMELQNNPVRGLARAINITGSISNNSEECFLPA